MKTTNMIKRTLTVVIAAALITATAMLSGCGCDDNISSSPDTATTVQTTSVENENGESTTSPTLSETDQAITDAGLKVDKDGNITDKDGKKVKVDKDGKVEVKNEKGETVKIDASEVEKVNQNKTKKDTNTTKKSNISSSKSETSKKNTSSSKLESSKFELSKTPQSSSSSSSKSDSSNSESSTPTQKSHTHSWMNITEKVKVVDQKAYSYEDPVYEEQDRTICNDCNADITDLGSAGIRRHCGKHLENGEKGSYRNEWVEVQTGTKTVTVPEKSHYETKTIGRKCSSCGKVEYY